MLRKRARIHGLWLLKVALAGALGLLPGYSRAASPDACLAVEQTPDGVYLLTMSPGEELFSIFGHNGLYVLDREFGYDTVFNFGVYDSSNPNLLQGFLGGTLDYMLDTRSFDSMVELYAGEGRHVVMHRLNLARHQVLWLQERLFALAQSDTRSYRYHWFAANCSTKIRDLLDELLGGALSEQHQGGAGVSKRFELMRHASHSLFAWAGFRYAFAHDAERELTWWETTFLPERMLERLERSTILTPSGPRPLLDQGCVVVQGRVPPTPLAPPPWDAWLWVIGLSLGSAMLALGLRPSGVPARCAAAGLTLVYGLVAAGLGIASTWMWAVRGIDIFWANENLFLAHPASALLVGVAVSLCAHTPWTLRWAARVTQGLLAVALVGVGFSALRGFPHHNLAVIGLFVPPLLALTMVVRDAARRSQLRGRRPSSNTASSSASSRMPTKNGPNSA